MHRVHLLGRFVQWFLRIETVRRNCSRCDGRNIRQVHADDCAGSAPSTLGGRVWRRWKQFGARAATFQARVLLTLFYWSVLPLFAIALRAFSDPLQLRRDRGGRWKPVRTIDPWKQS